MAIEIKEVVKSYNNNASGFTLNLPYIFLPSKGLVAIFGKSGCGKSTLLNLLAGFLKPDKGQIIVDGRDIVKFKEKDNCIYHNQDCSLIFQHYNLLDNETIVFNIALPALINGQSKNKSFLIAENLLKEIDFPIELYNTKCSKLSGGEKQRVAILRSLINNPKIILADEPTGALDSTNSEKIMKMLKDISKNRLVIVVSHNEEICKKYSDFIVEISNGQITKTVGNIENEIHREKANKLNNKTNFYWKFKLALSNIKKRKNRIAFASLALIVGFIFTSIIIGFESGNSNAIHSYSEKQLDYGSAILYKETNTKIENSNISITKQIKPSKDELDMLSNQLKSFYIRPNLTKLFGENFKVTLNEKDINDIVLCPIFSFNDKSFDSSLYIKKPAKNAKGFLNILINKAFDDYIKETFKKESTLLTLNIESKFCNRVNIENNDIIDYFVLNEKFSISGIVDEMDFLTSKKIYFSYLDFEEYLHQIPMNNMSKHKGQIINWFDYADNGVNNDSINSFSVRIFLKDCNNKKELSNLQNKLPNNYKISSNSIIVSDALINLITAATMGMDIFLIFVLLGICLIIGITSFSSYIEDRKKCAILSSFGANKNDINSIFLTENILICVLSSLISIPFSFCLYKLLNNLVNALLGIKNIISSPFSLFSFPCFAWPFTLIIVSSFIAIISSYIPIKFSIKIPICKELKDE